MMAVCGDANFVLSNHAATRMAQRSIRGVSLDLVLMHGTRVKAQRNCEEYILAERDCRHLIAIGLDKEAIAAASKLRAIVDYEGNVVTCYYQRRGHSRPFNRGSYLRSTKLH